MNTGTRDKRVAIAWALKNAQIDGKPRYLTMDNAGSYWIERTPPRGVMASGPYDQVNPDGSVIDNLYPTID